MPSAWIITFLLAFIAIETIAFFAVAYFAYKNAMIIFRVQDAIEESLDILDNRYESISKILKIPLFYDSPEIKNAVNDISKSRDAILYVANQLTSIQEQEDEGREEDNKA
jgi:hypothetical protein